MSKRKLLLSLVAVFTTLVTLGVYRLVDERQSSSEPTSAEVAPRAASASLDLLAPWRAFAVMLGDVATSIAGSHSVERARVAPQTLSMDGNWLLDPDWLSRPEASLDRAREARVKGARYREEPAGVRTILTSGRRIGASDIRLPEAARARLGAGEQSRTVRALVCVNRRGRPTEVRITDGTGASQVDAVVARELLAERFRPLRSGGRAVGFCERVTVVVSS
jgi:hypothetical protein